MASLTLQYYFYYLLLSAILVVVVGRQLYRKGQVYLDLLFMEEHQAKAINRLLLLGYYLLNLGYVAYKLSIKGDLHSHLDLFEQLAASLGFISILLGALHINNLALLFILSKSKFNLKST